MGGGAGPLSSIRPVCTTSHPAANPFTNRVFFMRGQRGLQSRATQNGRVTGQMFIDGKPGSKAVLATFKRGAVQLP